ncbi:MAG TPA: acetyl-CoA C-acyltransferase [Clostridiales bacterium]|nr:acetyl-CoA C-acyltransferase [Clostridiales bacterium]
MFKDVYVISYARTPVGKFGGSLKNVSTIDLATHVIKNAIARSDIKPTAVEEVVMGCVGQYGLNAFLGRIAALNAGCAIESSGQTVNRLCASGLQAIVTAATAIDHRDMSVVVAGGAENMSGFPFSSFGSRWGLRMGNAELVDTLLTALIEPFSGEHIASTAENIAERYGLSRERIDAYAVESQVRAANAIANGYFVDEIVPLEVKDGKDLRLFTTDEHPRQTSQEQLAKLKTIFKKDGVVTAGNSSGINDAAAAMVLMDSETMKQNNCKPKAKILDYAVSGVDPKYMGMGPVNATNKLLEKCGMDIKEIGLWELNEAFAAQAVACMDELGLDPSIVNVNGSGISLGHPIGATGAIIAIKLLSEMKRRNIQYGIATLCIGGGQGLSVLFENV